MSKYWTLLLLVCAFLSGTAWALPKERKGKRNCTAILQGIAEKSVHPLHVTNPNNKGASKNYAVHFERREVGDMIVEKRDVREAEGDLPAQAQIERIGNQLVFNPPLHKLKGKASASENENEEALRILDEGREKVAGFAIQQERARRNFPEAMFNDLSEGTSQNWDASQVLVRSQGTDGKAGEVLGSLRVISSGPDRRLLPYPELLKNFLKTQKGKWRRGWVEASLTRPLILEKTLGTMVERPILDIPEGLKLPSGEMLYSLVGEAKEIGALAIRQDLAPQTYNLVAQELFRSLFDSGHSNDYNQNGQLFYAWGEKTGIALWRRSAGWEVLDPEKPFYPFEADANGEKQAWWIIRHTPQTLVKWVEGLAKRTDFSEEDAKKLRYLFQALSDPELTDRQREIWNKYYLEGKTQKGIAEELGIAETNVNRMISTANDRIQIRMGMRPPPTPFNLEDVFYSAKSNSEKKALDKAVAKVRAKLSPRQKQVLDLKLQGMWNASIGRELGISRATVTKIHDIIQEKLESELDGKIPLARKPPEMKFDALISAVADPKPGESNEVKEIRKVLYKAALEPRERDILDRLRRGETLEQIMERRNISKRTIIQDLYEMLRRLEQVDPAAPPADFWNRFWTTEEKENFEAALAKIYPGLTPQRKKIWDMHHNQKMTGPEIGEALGFTLTNANIAIREIRKIIDYELGTRPDPSLYSWEAIVEAADTKAKKQKLDKVVAEVTSSLTDRQKEIWRLLSKKGLTTREVSEKIHDGQGNVVAVNLKVKGAILEKLGDEFNVEVRKTKLEQLAEALNLEANPSPEKNKLHKSLYRMSLARTQIEILEGIKRGQSQEEIAAQRNMSVHSVQLAIQYLYDAVKADSEKPSASQNSKLKPWEKLLTEEEREEVDAAFDKIAPSLNPLQLQVWEMFWNQGKGGTAIAEELKMDRVKVNGTIYGVKSRLEREL